MPDMHEETNMQSTVKPIFLYSMPRSGSTLLQRILGSHEEICTVSEPCLLLPLLSTYTNVKMYNNVVMHGPIQVGIADFISELPNGLDDYTDELRKFVLELYSKIGNGKPYFLDKTPPYAIIAPQVVDLFPSAKHVVLWRNPLSILTSIVHTFESNAWAMGPHKLLLYWGMECLLQASRMPNVYCIKYEDLLTNPHETLANLFQYLELEYSEEIVSSFPTLKLNGELGDPTGVHEYKALSQQPLGKWEQAICNPYRRLWARKYLNWLGNDRLAQMGYSLDDLLIQMKSTRTKPETLLQDLIGNFSRFSRHFAIRNFDIDLATRKGIKSQFALLQQSGPLAQLRFVVEQVGHRLRQSG